MLTTTNMKMPFIARHLVNHLYRRSFAPVHLYIGPDFHFHPCQTMMLDAFFKIDDLVRIEEALRI